MGKIMLCKSEQVRDALLQLETTKTDFPIRSPFRRVSSLDGGLLLIGFIFGSEINSPFA